MQGKPNKDARAHPGEGSFDMFASPESIIGTWIPFACTWDVKKPVGKHYRFS
jgi:hypothetical protein